MGVLSHAHRHALVRTAYIPVYYAASTLVSTPVFDLHTPSHLRSNSRFTHTRHSHIHRERETEKESERERERREREGREREREGRERERGREVEGSRGDKSLRRE